MTLSKTDLAELKWSIVALVLSIGLCGVLFNVSDNYLRQSLKERQAAQKQLSDARAQLVASQGDQENMSTYAKEYNALQIRKIIGDEQRLDWIEGLEKLRQEGHALDFKYTIAPQKPYVPDPPVEAGNFQLNRSAMTLQIDLLHEEQLLHLFAAMRTRMSGWLMLDGCTLSRENINDAAKLKADCTGGWFTMKNKSTP